MVIFGEKKLIMIIFNELRFTDDLVYLELNCNLDQISVADGYFISAVYLEYYKNRNVTLAPSDRAAIIFNNENNDETITSVNLTGDNAVPYSVLSLVNNGVAQYKDGLFYVIVSCRKNESEPNEETQFYTIVNEVAAVLDWQAVYNTGMNAVNELTESCSKSCDEPAFLEQYIIVWHSFNLALEAKDMDQMDKLWSRFISFSATGRNSCNCK